MTCGAPGTPCCGGNSCQGAGCCYSGLCVAETAACGATAGLCQGSKCSGCGSMGQPCCGATCYDSLECRDGSCASATGSGGGVSSAGGSTGAGGYGGAGGASGGATGTGGLSGADGAVDARPDAQRDGGKDASVDVRDGAKADVAADAPMTADGSAMDGPGCTPGRTAACACEDGQPATMACLADGSGFGPCDCPAPRCGDGHRGPDEACDDGNDDDTDSCLVGCIAARCGDGVVRATYETCDGNCPTTCDDGDICTKDTLAGKAASCNVTCINDVISVCGPGEGCCPLVCTPESDSDCNGCRVSNPTGVCPAGQYCAAGTCTAGTVIFSQSTGAQLATDTFSGAEVSGDLVRVTPVPYSRSSWVACADEFDCELSITGLPTAAVASTPKLRLESSSISHTPIGGTCGLWTMEVMHTYLDGVNAGFIDNDDAATCRCDPFSATYNLNDTVMADGAVSVRIEGFTSTDGTRERIALCGSASDGPHVSWTVTYDSQVSGSVVSVAITPAGGQAVGALVADADAGVRISVLDGAGALIPDTVLPGNAAGFLPGTISLASLPPSTYPTLSLRADLRARQVLRRWQVFAR